MKKPRESTHFDKKFGLYVKKKRVEFRWSQVELADKLGNNFQNISRLERGEISPTFFWCYKLCTAFCIEMDELVKEFEFNPKKL